MNFFARLKRLFTGGPRALPQRGGSSPTTWDRRNYDESFYGASWADQLERLLHTDAELARCDRLLRASIERAGWVWRPGNGGVIAARNADYMNRMFGLSEPGAPEQRRQGLLMQPWGAYVQRFAHFASLGFGVHELIYDVRLTAQGPEVFVSDFEERPATTIASWMVDNDGLLYVQQSIGVGSGCIPGEQAQVFTLDGRGRDYEGRHGLARPGYPWATLSRLCWELSGIAAERWSLKTPLVTDNRHQVFDRYTDPQIERMVQDVIDAAEAYAAGETAYLITNAAASLGVYGGGTFDSKGLVELAAWAERRAQAAYGLSMLGLGESQVGAKNLFDGLQGSFERVVASICWQMAYGLSGRPRGGGGNALRCLDWTFGPQLFEDYPVMEPTGIEALPIAEIANVVPNWLAVEADVRAPQLWHELARSGGVDLSKAPPPEQWSGRPRAPRLRDLDPSAGGIPAQTSGER